MSRDRQSSLKRPRGSPTFLTPTNPCKRAYPRRFLHGEKPSHRGRRRIFSDDVGDHASTSSSFTAEGNSSRRHIRVNNDCWTSSEVTALVEFILLHSSDDKWPFHHQQRFWETAASFIQMRANTKQMRSGNSCRYKVKWLKKRYQDPKAAEKVLFTRRSIGVQATVSQQCKETQTDTLSTDVATQTDVPVTPPLLPTPSQSEQSPDLALSSLSKEFSKQCHRLKVDVPVDFLTYAASAMVRLKKSKRSNVLYNLAKSVGTDRADSSDARFPTLRMPMGLFEHVTNFYVAENINQVPTCPSDYLSWLQTMYSQFGQKWGRLYHGPMWSIANLSSASERSTMQALANVPSVSERKIRRHIAAGNVTIGSEIQVSVLDDANRVHPRVWWWIKADGVDLVEGLGTSVTGVWSGDVDLGDGSLMKAYDAHKTVLESINSIGRGKQSRVVIVQQLAATAKQIVTDLDFICSKLKVAAKKYDEKQAEGKSREKVMFALAWDIKELENLNKTGRELAVDCECLKDRLLSPGYNPSADNFPKVLQRFKENMMKFAKSVVKFRRTAATHLLVFMISPEQRNRKPYALPVQCLPYSSLGDNDVQTLCAKVIQEMVNRGMKVAGFCTNGEWNSLRSKGTTRPIDIFEIRRQVRGKYQRMGVRKLTDMLTPTVTPDGSLKTVAEDSPVSKTLLTEIAKMLSEKCSMDEVVTCLRHKTVPDGHKIHPWVSGREETKLEKMKSILAQLEYTSTIRSYVDKGIPFNTHLHIPEVHKCTGYVVLQREDEGHLFKRIANSLRQGRMKNIGLERFVEALTDKDAGLTYPALTGERKQSVQDVERLFGFGVIEFMNKHKYKEEHELLLAVRNWRRAIDERGLTETMRQQFLQQFKDYICRDLMPWYNSSELKDFSLLEVNRPIDNVRGFTAETLIGVAASIETRLWRYKFNVENGLAPEHPRSSTTDDVECFFSLLRDCVGKNFTLKQACYEWRKVTTEFAKRMDPCLSFYYYTGTDRFYEEEMPSFNEPRRQPKRDRLPQRELIPADTGRRASFPVRGTLSIRATFHAKPVYMPPYASATTVQKVMSEHSYA